MSEQASTVHLPKLISKAKVAEILGEAIEKLAASPDFPKPWASINNRPYYRAEEILKLQEKKP